MAGVAVAIRFVGVDRHRPHHWWGQELELELEGPGRVELVKRMAGRTFRLACEPRGTPMLSSRA